MTENGDKMIVHDCRTFKRSPAIGQIGAALAKAQGQIQGAAKSAANPFFKSKYADLSSVIEAIREPFSANEIGYAQFVRSTEGGVEVETLFVHSSGEWFSDTLFVPCAKWDAQGIGSAVSYGKRYGLQAMSGCPSEDDYGKDDDGNAAVAGLDKSRADAKGLREYAMGQLTKAAEKGNDYLDAAWKELTEEARRACDAKELKALRGVAAKV